jgi:cAMP and cAMP-inhibited cGMP 3',5'-cyclic phosphodiesterase 10
MLFVQVLGNMKHCILATDLALFFPNKARLANIVKENSFSWDIPDHRLTYTLYISRSGKDICLLVSYADTVCVHGGWLRV